MRDVEQALFTTFEQDGIFHIQCSGLVPGPGHVYATLIVGENKALLIDNGWGEDELAEYVRTITKLPIQAVVTHAHPDHMGGYTQFTDLWLHEKELPFISETFPDVVYNMEESILNQTRLHGLKGIEQFDLGGRTVQIVETPGHTQGSICFYDDKTEIMVTGDTLSQRVFLFCSTPPIPFSVYRESLLKLQSFNFKKFLAAHHPLPMPYEWVEKMIGMIDSFSPEKGRVYKRDGISESIHLYTVGQGFGDSEYCGFAYNEEELTTLLK